MRHRRTATAAAALLSLLALAPGCPTLHTRPAPGLDEGAAAPFTLTSHEGAEVSLAQVVAGGVGVVVFYRGYW